MSKSLGRLARGMLEAALGTAVRGEAGYFSLNAGLESHEARQEP